MNSLAFRQVKACAEFIEKLEELAKQYDECGCPYAAKACRGQIPVWRGHVEFWEQTLIEETKAKAEPKA